MEQSLEIKDFFLVACALITAAVTVFNWRASRFRGKLKDDLEIQKRYREELHAVGKSAQEISTDKHYVLLQSKITRKMDKAYLLRGTDWSDAAISLFFLICTIYVFFNTEIFGIEIWQPVGIAFTAPLCAVYAFFAIRHRGRPSE
jgi:hypothetical protein